MILAWLIPLLCAVFWLGCARANFAYLCRKNRLIKGEMVYKRGYAEFHSHCPDYHYTWHRVNKPCRKCGDFFPDLSDTREYRMLVALLTGPFMAVGLSVGLLVGGGVHSHDELQAELHESEARLAEANRKLEELQ